jgi:hypothetical protein
MSRDAELRLRRWSEWLGELGMGVATEEQYAAVIDRWQRGEEPPNEPATKEWPNVTEKK